MGKQSKKFFFSDGKSRGPLSARAALEISNSFFFSIANLSKVYGNFCKTDATNPQYSLTCVLLVGLRVLSHVVDFPSICSSKFAPDSQLFFPQRQFLESFLRCKGDGSKEYANVHCKLNDRQLLKIALQVALGMKHLEEQKVNRTFSQQSS